jgi:hypothetical protein
MDYEKFLKNEKHKVPDYWNFELFCNSVMDAREEKVLYKILNTKTRKTFMAICGEIFPNMLVSDSLQDYLRRSAIKYPVSKLEVIEKPNTAPVNKPLKLRKYTEEQRLEALRLLEEGFSPKEISVAYDIPTGTLYRWKSELPKQNQLKQIEAKVDKIYNLVS